MSRGSADQPPSERVEHERYGMLELLRTHKDDGRSLILYSHDEPDGDDHPSQTPGGEPDRA